MISQRLTADQRTMTATLTIECAAGDVTGYAEVLALQEELKLRANIRTEGSIIALPAPEDVPPPPG